MALRLVEDYEIMALRETQDSLMKRIAEYEEQLQRSREQIARLRDAFQFFSGLAALWHRPSVTDMAFGNDGWELLSFDLTHARDDEPYYAVGFGFIVEEITGSAYIRLNSPFAEKTSLQRVKSMPAFFFEIYVSNDAQPGGTLKLRICKDIRAWYSITPEVKRSFVDYDVINVANTVPFVDREFAVTGNYLTVIQSSGTWSIKFNSREKPALSLSRGDVIQLDFTRLYISGQGDGGNIQLYIGKES